MTLIAIPLMTVGLNLGVCIWFSIATWRAHRAIRHALDLDALLAKICVEAYANHHRPIWAAWMAVMGDIKVEITQSRSLPEAD